MTNTNECAHMKVQSASGIRTSQCSLFSNALTIVCPDKISQVNVYLYCNNLVPTFTPCQLQPHWLQWSTNSYVFSGYSGCWKHRLINKYRD